MEGNGQTLYWFSNEKITLDVPFFQRPYVWDEGEWTDLEQSISSAAQDSMPFIGSFILQKTNNKNEYLIIDGQQRITTLSILIKAFLDNVNIDANAKPQFINIIYKEDGRRNLIPIYKNRLKPSHIDSKDYELVMKQDLKPADLEDKHGLIVKAYKWFSKYFNGKTYDENIEIGSKILTNNKFFISIILNEEDDEQEIFDSVNSLGRDLTNSDIIKNSLFQILKEKSDGSESSIEDIKRYHKDYWEDIFYSDAKRKFWDELRTFGRFKLNTLEAFLKNFAIIKKIYIASETGGIGGLAKSFKNYFRTLNYVQLLDFCKELAEYANCYYAYTTEYDNMTIFKLSDIKNTTLLILDKSETTTFDSYILFLLKNNPSNKDEQLKALQKFIVERMVYKVSTKNYNKVSENLMDPSKDPIQYLESINKRDITTLTNFPDGLRNMKNKQALIILFIVELIRRKDDEGKYNEGLEFNSKYTVEHVMPQKWEEFWSVVPSYRCDGIYNPSTSSFHAIADPLEIIDNRKNAIYSIGNLTILKNKLNASISNHPIDKKIDGDAKNPGIRKFVAGFSITDEIVKTYDQDNEWTEKQITARSYKIFTELNDYYNFRKN